MNNAPRSSGGTQSALAVCLATLGRFEEAESLQRGAYAALQQSRGQQDRRTQEASQGLVALYEAWGKPEDAQRSKNGR